jgi:hypothetical protein
MKKHFRTLRLAQLLAVGCVLSLSVVSVRAATMVTECGQVVSGLALLANDIECDASWDMPAVLMSGPGRLMLQGHTISHVGDTDSRVGVACVMGCKVVGPGTISGGVGGIEAYGRVRVDGVMVKDARYSGVVGLLSCRVKNSIVRGNGIGSGRPGVLCDGPLSVVGSTIENNGSGVRAGRLVVLGAKARILRSLIASNVGDGVDARSASVIDSTVTNNGAFGVAALKKLRLSSTSMVEANCQVTSDPCADIGACGRVRVTGGSICGSSMCEDMALESGATCATTSFVHRACSEGPTWRVCLDD